MCNIDRNQEMVLLAMGLNFIFMLIEAEGLPPQQSTDVLAVATKAYQQGKITKTQFMAVINALDEQVTYKHPNNRAQIEATAYLNQYR